jgi:hypothetical protein
MNFKNNNNLIKGVHMVNSETDTEESQKLMREKNILYFIREITKALLSSNSIEEMSKKVYTFLKDNYGECTIGLAVNLPKEKKVSDCFFFENEEKLDFEDILYSEGSASKLLKSILNKKEYIFGEKNKDRSFSFYR